MNRYECYTFELSNLGQILTLNSSPIKNAIRSFVTLRSCSRHFNVFANALKPTARTLRAFAASALVLLIICTQF